MAVKTIRLLGDPILWENCSPVEAFDSEKGLCEDLRGTLMDFRKRSGFGRGIAAPQIGVSKRAIYVAMSGDFEGIIFNPEILSESSDRFELWDDCFSFPDLLVRVSRAQTIQVRYQDETGITCRLEASDAFSELLQHEIDHINGILAIDRASEWVKRK